MLHTAARNRRKIPDQTRDGWSSNWLSVAAAPERLISPVQRYSRTARVQTAGNHPLKSLPAPSPLFWTISSRIRHIVFADVFEQVPATFKSKDLLAGPRLRVVFRIIDGYVVHQSVMIRPPEAFDHVQRLRMRVPYLIEPGFVVQADRIDDQISPSQWPIESPIQEGFRSFGCCRRSRSTNRTKWSYSKTIIT